MEHLEYLKWVLQSPSLLNRQQSPFRLTLEPEPQDIEHVLSIAPEKLDRALKKGSSHFLGSMFERLWQFYLEHSLRFELIAANLQVHHEGVTLGELDFLTRDNHTNKVLHQEIAVKFYLGTHLPSGETRWIGPNALDRLDLKLSHLKQKQLPFADRPETRKLLQEQFNIDAIESEVLLKGRLFLPMDTPRPRTETYLNPNHLCGHWCHYSSLLKKLASAHEANHYWLELNKPDWLTQSLALSAGHETMQDSNTLAHSLHPASEQQRARQFCKFIKSEGTYLEVDRVFAVPSGWPG